MKPALTLRKQTNSFVANTTLVEKVCKEDVLKLCYSDRLPEKDQDHWLSAYTKAYGTTLSHLQDYLRKYEDKYEGIPVVYKLPRHQWGRPFPKNSLGFSAFVRSVRHTIAGEYYDIDLYHAQPQIIYYTLKMNQIPVPLTVEAYALHREAILADHMRLLGVTEKWMVKQLFISLFFMGTYYGFKLRMKKLNIIVPEEEPVYVKELSKDLVHVASVLKTRNADLYKSAYCKRKDQEDNVPNKILRTFCALWAQTAEFMVVDKVMEFIDTNTPLMKTNDPNVKMASYEFDGFKLLKCRVDEYDGGIDAVLQLCNDYCATNLGLPLRFEVKGYDEAIDIDGLTIPDNISLVPVTSDAEKSALLQEITYVRKSHLAGLKVLEAEDFSMDFLFVRKANEWYTWDGDTWERSPHHFLVQYGDVIESHFQNKLPVDCLSDEVFKKELFELKCTLGTSAYVSGVEKLGKTFLSCFDREFDTNPNLLNFKNGVLDIDNKCFRDRRREDFVQMSTGYDFYYEVDEPEYKAEIMTILSQIHPDPEILEFFMMTLASSLSGANIDKFFIWNGGGRNGKSVTTLVMKLILGDYFATGPPSVLIESPKHKSSAEANPTLANFNKKRMVVFSEPPKNIPLQNSVVKVLTGGGVLHGRQLFKGIQDIVLHMTMVLETNAVPNMAESCMVADTERLLDTFFGSTFTSDEKKWDESKHIYPKNRQYTEVAFWKERRNAFLNILVEYLYKLHDTNYDMGKFVPKAITDRTYLYTLESHLVYRLFKTLFKPKDEFKVMYVEPYCNWDTDPTLQQVVSEIRSCDGWYSQPPYIRNNKENGAEKMKQWFKETEPFCRAIYEESRYIKLRGYRRITSMTDLDGDTESTDLESSSTNSFSVDKV